MQISKILYRTLSYSLGFVSSQRGNLKILMYHRIQSCPKGTAYLQPEWFSDHMSYLSDFGYVSYTLRDVWESWPDILNGPKAIVLTFDDVWASHVDVVLPILKQHGFKGTFFVPTAHIEKERHKPVFSDLSRFEAELCSWKDIEVLEAEGMEIGGHTHTHSLMTELSSEDVWQELCTCRRILDEHVQTPVVSFCYPFGKVKTFNSDIVQMVAKQGYKVACTTIWGYPTKNSNLLMLPRIGVSGNDNLFNFKRKLKGRYDFLRWINRWR